MKQKKLGRTSVEVGAIGLGAMPLSLDGRPPEEQALAVIHRALDLGVTLIDTADAYCIDERDKHHNERLIAKALSLYKGNTGGVIVATKGGLMRPNGDWVSNGDPRHIHKTIHESYQALGGQRPIPLWQLHAPDPRFDLSETLKPVREAVGSGLVRFVGLSNVDVQQVEQAREIVEIVSVQNQYNPWRRTAEKDGILAYCEREKLTFLPWSPLGGSDRVRRLNDIPVLRTLSQERGVSPQRIVLAWMLARSPAILPIPGASKKHNLEDSVAAADLALSPEDVEKIDRQLP
ncbi:MAG TPA: aldo/keto reductase [bacterium]|nr:aldo/keto reductase [bacterium]